MKTEETEKKLKELQGYFAELAAEDICLAFSGGVDSSLLLKAAAKAAIRTKKQVYAVTFDSRLHPSCDLDRKSVV